MKTKYILGGMALSLLLLVNPLAAVKVKVIEKTKFNDFQKGSFQNISVGRKGLLTLGPKFKPVAGPAEEYYFSLGVGATGDIVVGTGHNAAIYRIPAAGGEAEQIYRGDQIDVYALLVEASGDVVAATSPNGKVIRISAKDKKVTDVFDPEGRFIWDMKAEGAGNIICAVGNPAGVFSITPDGQVETLFNPEDAHIMSLAIALDGSIFAGSGDRGVLYQIKNRKIKVLYDSPLDEVRSICEDRDGNVYFAVLKNIAAQRVAKEFELGGVFRKSRDEEKTEIKEKSILYCLRNDGNTDQLWSSEEEFIYTLHYDKTMNAVVMGTGNSGRIYRIESNGDYSLFMESESAQVYKIVGSANGFVAVSNNTASLVNVESGLNSTGTYFSEVIDNRLQSRFGKITWNADLPAQTTVQFSVRYGNSENADSSWTTWSAPFNDPDKSDLNTSGYRFLQVKAALNSQSPNVTPILNSFRIYYMESNRAPLIKEIATMKIKSEEGKSGGESEKLMDKNLRFRWEVNDPNQDNLLFHLYLKKVSDKGWLQIQKNLQEREFILEMENYEDGKYLLKVEADDVLDNSPTLAKKSSLISSPFLIDSTAPVIRDWAQNGTSTRFLVADETSAVSRVLYSYDGKEWLPVFPEDQIADSKTESFLVTFPDVEKKAFVFIKVMDEFDNYRVYQKEL